MKALFITTQTNDTHNHVDAWDSVSDIPAKRVQFDYQNGVGNDAYIRNKARDAGDVDVIFYIGCNRGGSLPSYDTLRELRKIAPLINIISDAADQPWHALIAAYRREECFDLQVGIDGEPESPVDLATLTPVDSRIFDSVKVGKDIRCGFSGNAAGKRSEILGGVGSRCWVRIRGDDYLDHVRFLRRCRMVLNIAYTGSGKRLHVKVNAPPIEGAANRAVCVTIAKALGIAPRQVSIIQGMASRLKRVSISGLSEIEARKGFAF